MAKKNYESRESLIPVKQVISEANKALKDPNRTINSSDIAGILNTGTGTQFRTAFASITPEQIKMIVRILLTIITFIPVILSLRQEKIRLFKKATQEYNDLHETSKKESNQSEERKEYLRRIFILLEQIIRKLAEDIGIKV
jgi:hypothetical protein